MLKSGLHLWAIAALIQVIVALGLFVFCFSDTFGLAYIVNDGARVLQDARQIENHSSGNPNNAYLLSTLSASWQLLVQLRQLLMWIGIVLVISVAMQFAALQSIRKERLEIHSE